MKFSSKNRLKILYHWFREPLFIFAWWYLPMKELAGILIRVCKILNCKVSLSMCLVITEKEFWTELISSNFCLDPLVLNKKIKIESLLNQNSSLLKTREFYFSLVWIMEFSIISSSLVKSKFSWRFYLPILVDVQRLFEKGK